MTGPEKRMDDSSLDALFAEMGRDNPQPSEALMSRIIADAAAAQPDLTPQPAPRRGVWDQFMDAVGGWPSLGGLVTATAAGLYIGFVQPDVLMFQAETVEEEAEFSATALWPDDGLFFDEG